MLREILARFGIRVNTRPLKTADAATTGFIKRLNIMGGILAGGLMVRGLRNFVTQQIQTANLLGDTATKLGLTTDALQELRFAAERTGVGQRALDVGLQRFTRRAAEAARGTGTAAATLRELGIQLKDSQGRLRPTEELLGDVAEAFTGVESQADRVRLAFSLFDTEGVDLVNTLAGGREGLEELRAEFRALGGGISVDAVERAGEAADAMQNFDVTLTSLKSVIVVDLLPSITRFAQKIGGLLIQLREVTEGTGIWKAALIALGAIASAVAIAMFVAFIKPIAIILLIAGVIFLVVLAIDDLLTFMQGGESVIGKFFDAIGVDSNKARRNLNFFADDQKTFWGETFPALLSSIGPKFDRFADDQKTFWGTDLPNAIGAGIASINVFFGNIQISIFETIAKIGARVLTFVADVRAAISSVVQSVQGVAGFFGFSQAAAPRGAPSLRGGGGGGTSVAQDVSVVIDNRGGGDTRGITRAVQSAMERANDLMIRNAQRALTQVAD